MTALDTIVLHASAGTAKAFTERLQLALERANDDGYQIVGISHAASISCGDEFDAELYSAVVWAQREPVDADTDEEEPR